jgi:hypothetical protein
MPARDCSPNDTPRRVAQAVGRADVVDEMTVKPVVAMKSLHRSRPDANGANIY